MWKRCATGVLLVAVLTAGWCGVAGAVSTAVASKPSLKAKMVCAGEARGDIAGVLAVKPVAVSSPTWIDRLYSCTYQYRSGSFTLSVKELPDRAATVGYFDSLGTTLGRERDQLPLGDGAFQTPNGSIVVRKDNKVLEVDASTLPPRFTKLGLSPADVASTVAMTILGCWKG